MFRSGYTPGGVANVLAHSPEKGSQKEVRTDASKPLQDLFSKKRKPHTTKIYQSTVPFKKLKQDKESANEPLHTVPVSRKAEKRQNSTVFKRETALRNADSDTARQYAKRKKHTAKLKSATPPQKHTETLDDAADTPIKLQSPDSLRETKKRKTEGGSADNKLKKNATSSHGTASVTQERDEKKDHRTIFVGNLPVTTTKKVLRKVFRKFGKIESVRFRSAAPKDLKLSKKATIITKSFHAERHTLNSYVVFEEESAAEAALSSNGMELDGLHIRVDLAGKEKKVDNTRSIFVGNLPFGAEEEPLREHFIDCGQVDNVRIIRDSKTGLGKGFGYVLFKDKESVDFALKFHGKEFSGRELRVQRSTDSPKETGRQKTKASSSSSARPEKKKFRMPSNVSNYEFKGVQAQRLNKLEKRRKRKKKFLSQKNAKSKPGFDAKKAKGQGKMLSKNQQNAVKRLAKKKKNPGMRPKK